MLTQPCLQTFCRRVCNSPQKKFLIGRTEFAERNTVLTLWGWPIDIVNLVFNVRECKLLSNSKSSKTLVFDMAPLWKKWPFLSKLTVNESQLSLKVCQNSLERQHFCSSWLFMHQWIETPELPHIEMEETILYGKVTKTSKNLSHNVLAALCKTTLKWRVFLRILTRSFHTYL